MGLDRSSRTGPLLVSTIDVCVGPSFEGRLYAGAFRSNTRHYGPRSS